jgi:hypothetical protein
MVGFLKKECLATGILFFVSLVMEDYTPCTN